MIGRIFAKKEKELAINIGIAEKVLSIGKSFSLYPRPSLLVAYKWKRKRGRVFIYPRRELNPHIVIIGMSGAGKSSLLKSMLISMRDRIACIVFDPNNEYESIVKSIGGNVVDASTSGINLLGLDGLTVGDRIEELTSILSRAYHLGYLQETKLNSCLWYTYMHSGARSRKEVYVEHEPSIKDMLSELSAFIKNARTSQEENSLRNMYQKLCTLDYDIFSSNKLSMEWLSKGVTSLSLGSIGSSNAKIIYIAELVKRLYRFMHDAKKEHGLSVYIMIDESQLILRGEESSPIISDIIEEGRKFGFGTIIVSHMASRLDRRIIANSSMFIAFNSKEPHEVNYVSGVLSGNVPEIQEHVREKLHALGRHEAIFSSTLNSMPMLIKTQKTPTLSERTNEAKILAMLMQPMRVSKFSALARDEGLRALHKLKEHMLVDSFYTDGEEWVMRHSKLLSIEHEVRIRQISDRLSECGIANRVNKSFRGPDIIAGKIAIEYETGRKRIASTLRMLAKRKEYEKVIVIANDNFFEMYKGIGNAFKFSEFIGLECNALHDILGRKGT
ncbi:MAG: ATP-binding protein [Candidatus Micrarchaeia archaeon]